MKKLLSSLLLLIIIGWTPSCRHDLDSADDGNKRNHPDKEKPELKTLTMSFGGDFVSESDEPLQRAEDGETYTAINVYYTEKDTENAPQKKYAYGLFVGKDPISIDIITGYTYRFEATILKEREDKIKMQSGGYSDPFRLHDEGSSTFDNAWPYISKDVDKFQYTYLQEDEKAKNYFCQLTSGTAYVNSGGDLRDINGNYVTGERWVRYPRVKRYYGRVDSFDPSSSETIEIPMTYENFGLKLVLESIPEGTAVKVKDATNYSTGPTPTDEPYLIFPQGLQLDFSSDTSHTWECIYSLNKFSSNTQEFILEFEWLKGAGKSEKIKKRVTVEARKMKVLKLSFTGDVNETKSGNIVFTNMEDSLELSEEEFKYDFGDKS